MMGIASDSLAGLGLPGCLGQCEKWACFQRWVLAVHSTTYYNNYGEKLVVWRLLAHSLSRTEVISLVFSVGMPYTKLGQKCSGKNQNKPMPVFV